MDIGAYRHLYDHNEGDIMIQIQIRKQATKTAPAEINYSSPSGKIQHKN